MTEWRERTLGEIVDHIETHHHAFLRDMLGRLKDLSSAAHAGADRVTLRTLDALDGVLDPLGIELEHHLMTEESAVFPLVREVGEGRSERAGAVALVIRHIENEHGDARDALAKLRELTSDFTPPQGASPAVAALFDALAELDADLVEHIRLESEVLFPRATRG